MNDLFDSVSQVDGNGNQPLAEVLRPKTIYDFVGQDEILKPDGLLLCALKKKKFGSYVFFGPPGVGKSTFAKLLANASKYHFEEISGVTGSSSDFKKILDMARLRMASGVGTLLLVDEVHRLNKSHQDIFLSPVEKRLITFIGATTQNPSSHLTSALLSRLIAIKFKSLDIQSLELILRRAEEAVGTELPISSKQRETLLQFADGDGRALLNRVEFILSLKRRLAEKEFVELMAYSNFKYSKTGTEHYSHASALQKSIRGSNVDAALYWLARMILGGEEKNFILRRLLRCSYEDIGLADPSAQSICLNAWDSYERLGSPEGDIVLAKAVIYLSMAPKSNSVYKALERAFESGKSTSGYAIPQHLTNTVSSDKLEEQKTYKNDHAHPDGFLGQDFFPEHLINQRYYNPVSRGFEKELGKRLKYFRELTKKNQSDTV